MHLGIEILISILACDHKGSFRPEDIVSREVGPSRFKRRFFPEEPRKFLKKKFVA